jgi:hypothetical protein
LIVTFGFIVSDAREANASGLAVVVGGGAAGGVVVVVLTVAPRVDRIEAVVVVVGRGVAVVVNLGVLISTGVVIPHTLVVPQYGSPLKHSPANSAGHETHFPVLEEHTDAMICSVVPTPHSFCTLHCLHTEPSLQKPETHAQLPHPTAVHEAFPGFKPESHAAQTELLPAVHGCSRVSPTEHCRHAEHWESTVSVHGIKNVVPSTHDRCWLQATHRSPER